MENFNFDFGNLAQEAIKWIHENILVGSLGGALMAFLKAFGNLLIKILEFVITIFQYLIGLLHQLLGKF